MNEETSRKLKQTDSGRWIPGQDGPVRGASDDGCVDAGPDAAVGVKLPGDPGDSLKERLEKLSFAIEKMNLAEYTALLRNPYRLLWVNFLAGSARGFGLGVGFAIMTAAVLYILRTLMLANLPFIGDFIAEVVRLVEFRLNP